MGTTSFAKRMLSLPLVSNIPLFTNSITTYIELNFRIIGRETSPWPQRVHPHVLKNPADFSQRWCVSRGPQPFLSLYRAKELKITFTLKKKNALPKPLFGGGSAC
jgi:hypothetical protein